ncbi:MAG: helix-turn-helix transcriptional regulator, partial [Gammaproteobacteria bacterium]|nr:helix-turn-helix transcriptional regulator [Gammaproteobacteria bacterium]
SIVRALAEAELDDERWPEASRLIDDCCGLVGSHLAIIRGDSRDDAEFLFGRLYEHGVANDELERTYVENYFAVDERVPRYFEMPDGELTHVNALVTESVRKNSPTYNEFLAPTGGGNSLLVHLDEPEDLHVVWLLARAGKPDDWSSDQMERIVSLLPHVRHFVRVRQALAGADTLRVRSMLDLLPNGRVGVFLLDRWGHIVETNDRARAMLRARNGLSDHRGFLCPCCKTDTGRLRRLLARVLPRAGGNPVGGSMPIQRHGGPPLVLHATPMSGVLSEVGPGSVAAVIIVADPLDKPKIDEARLSALLGLTPMQSRVAASLASGGTVKSIAVAINRSQETVRWHIKQIMARFGLSRQGDIVRLVLSTPGVFESR